MTDTVGPVDLAAARDPSPLDDEVVTRLAAIELRLRLLEVPEDAADVPPHEVELWLPSVAIADVVNDGVPDEPVDAIALTPDRPSAGAALVDIPTGVDQRLEWAAEAMRNLTEIIERLRAGNFSLTEQIADQRERANEVQARLAASLSVERATSRRLQEAMKRAYAEGQSARAQMALVKSSRSYSLGKHVTAPARWGHPQEALQEPWFVAEGLDPADVALVVASGTFDRSWYLKTYPDVAAAGVDPFAHFMTRGGVEARCPGPLFDIGWYEETYRSDLPEGINPLVYYLRSGWRKGHRPSQGFDPEEYVNAHPEIRGEDLCPLVYEARRVRG
jgi:hypothetical protein